MKKCYYLYNDQFQFAGTLVYQFVNSKAAEEPCSILQMYFLVQVPVCIKENY